MIVRPQGITSLRPFFCFEGTMVDDLLNSGKNVEIIPCSNNTIMERAAGKYGGTLPGHVEIWTIEGIIKR